MCVRARVCARVCVRARARVSVFERGDPPPLHGGRGGVVGGAAEGLPVRRKGLLVISGFEQLVARLLGDTEGGVRLQTVPPLGGVGILVDEGVRLRIVGGDFLTRPRHLMRHRIRQWCNACTCVNAKYVLTIKVKQNFWLKICLHVHWCLFRADLDFQNFQKKTR